MAAQHSDIGPHVKDPVTTAYPGKVPGDVARVQDDGVTTEFAPASTAPTGPASGNPPVDPVSSKDTVTRPLNEWAADEEEQSQISTSAADTLGGVTSRDVDQGIGKPVQGQSSVESHHDGRPGRKREGHGTSQFGVQGEPISNLKDTSLREVR